MLTVWRLVTTRFAATALTGEGARLYGGRWNQKGVPMVYTAGSQSLAMLEMLVQDDPLRARYTMIPVRVPANLRVESLDVARLPSNWQTAAARERLQAIGGEWIASARSAVLAVPSAIIPSETNYLLNPLHRSFGRVEIGTPQPFVTDLRLLRKTGHAW